MHRRQCKIAANLCLQKNCSATGFPARGPYHLRRDDLHGQVAKQPPGEREIRLPRSNHTRDFNMTTIVATLSGAWRYRVSGKNGCHSSNILFVSVARREGKFDLQLLSSCGSTQNCLRTSARAINVNHS